jgi:hypothetical protein
MRQRFGQQVAWMMAGAALAVLVAWSINARAQKKTAPLASLDVRELNIVDEHGNVRLRLGAPLPAQPPQGGMRRHALSGIQFIEPGVGEVGGLAMIDSIGVHGLCWDYGSVPGEALCFSLIKGQPRISVNDKKVERIGIGLDQSTAEIVVNDGEGKTRVRLEVDAGGHTRIDGVGPSTAK